MKTQKTILLFCLTLTAAWCQADNNGLADPSNVFIKESRVQGIPRTNSIVATLDGHTLSVVFLENLGQVSIELEGVDAGEAQYQSTPTPNGVDFYIVGTGSFVVYFTLPNGDVYYGEFEVTD